MVAKHRADLHIGTAMLTPIENAGIENAGEFLMLHYMHQQQESVVATWLSKPPSVIWPYLAFTLSVFCSILDL